MSNRVSSEQITKAKSINLINYLKECHPEMIKKDPHSNRYIDATHDSLVIMERGFTRFSTGDKGDQIQYVMNYLHMDFQDAVLLLNNYLGCGNSGEKCISFNYYTPNSNSEYFEKPEAATGKYRRVWSYLTIIRGIPAETVEKLFDDGTLYQDKAYGNCVFMSSKCKYAEIVGTTDIRFKKIEANSEPDGYWITGNTDSDTVYICESAIDAISLMVLNQKYNSTENAAYASMGGLKKEVLKRLEADGFKKVILAVDNDSAGYKFTEQHDEYLEIETPRGCKIKDWNEMLTSDLPKDVIASALSSQFRFCDVPF